MTTYCFDDSHIHWQQLDGIDHLQYYILDIDEPGRIIDVLFKFAAREQIVLHRHQVLNQTFVVQGEHRLYHADGSVKEIRPAGRYTISPASDEPHQEGGGDQDAIVFFSIRGGNGVLYQILDDAQKPVGELTMQDFIGLWQQQANSTSGV
ncbi:regulator [Methylomonas sp. MgM2]